ncbi:MAG: hypothetical protein K8S55_07180 [Phycisphaerae bacterium]|nr:hypothetical protein [Phycisphaerae bacterium]
MADYKTPIKCGRIAPPKQKSEGIKGEGVLEFHEKTIVIRISRHDEFSLADFLSVMLVSAVLAASVGLFIMSTMIARWIFCISATSSVLIITIRRWNKEWVFELETHEMQMELLRKGDVICLKLPDGKWLAIAGQTKKEHNWLCRKLTEFAS